MGCAHSCQRKEVFGLRAQAGPSGHEVHNAAFSIENEGPEERRQLHQTGEDGTKDAIAIVGIGCRTPGADNIRDFWRVLVNGECHVTDVPPDRWNAAAYLSDDVHAFGKAYVQKGGFIKGIEEFDNSLYGINDYEASQMDPQQRLLLDCTFMALEDAGFTRKQLSGSKTGVYIGSMNADHRSSSAAISSNIGSYTASSSANSFLSGRLSYVFNLLGPSVMIDTACSSSLIAIHLGCQAIHAGDCDQAICGGVNCMLLPDVFVHLSKARMISPSGLCHTFSDKADGYTRGEGCGIVILKRLTDALRDGDQVWATISTGTNQDGRTVTPVTAPSGEQQKKLLKDVYDKYPVDLSQLEYIEAHGTGTPTGDPVEVNAVGSFLKESGHLRHRYIGSVKTNIGHTESAAGALSVIKLCLMMKNNAIVPSLHCEVVNPNINLTDFKLLIPKAPVPWLTPEKLTCCSSFGFGGSNCHAILQSVRREPVRKETTASSCIVCFSGKCVQSLKGSLEDLCRDPDASDLNVHDVSYTSTVRRDHYLYRAAFLAKDMQDLMNAVGQRLSHDQWPEPDISNQQKLVFVFCGMGTSWDGMCRQLLVQHQIFKDSVVEVERHLSAYVPWSLTERLMKEDPSQDSLLDPIAVFACQVGLAAVWKSLGIESNYIVGQSVGEVAAAYTAGCFSLADAVKIIYYRSQLLAEVANGAMIVVLNVEVDQVRRVLTECGPGASVSQEYSSRACAISAPSDVMQGVRRSLQTRLNPGAQIINLPVRVAYHSPHVSHCAEKLSTVLKGIVAHPPSVHLQSSVTGAPLTTSPDAEYWAKNIRQPVLLNQAMTGVVRGSPKAVFLEIGPRPVLQAHLKNMFPSQKVTAVPSMLKPPEMDTLLKAAIMLYEEGIDIAWTAMRSEGSELTQVPRYCFNKKHHVEKSEARLAVLEGLDFFHKDHLYTWPVRDNTKSFRLMISPLIIPSVYDHVLSGKIIVPGAFMAEASLAVAHYCGITHPAVSIEFEQATSVRKKGEVTDLVAEFESRENSTKGDLPTLIIKRENRRLASAQLRECGPVHQEIVNLDYIRAKCKNVVDKSDIYSDLHKFGFQYGPTYSLLEQACKTSRECLAVLKPTDSIQEEIMSTCLHPSILDNMLQSTALVIMENGNLPGKAILPKSIGHLVVHRQVEPLMYVYTRLKQVSAKQCVFDQQLLSPTGQVIADSVDFVIQFLQTQTQEPVLTHLTTEWNRIVDTPPAFFLNGKQREPSPSTTFLFVTDNDIVHNNGHCIAVSFLNETAGENLGDEIKEKMVSHPPSGVVLICSEDTGDDTEGSAVQDRVVTLCHVIQVILQTLKTMSLNIGFYVCTTHAWPSAARNADSTKINPVATAVWGLVRTIVLERVYSNITAVDLCFPSGLNGLYLPGVFSYLSDTESVESYPELMITPDGVFANQVVKDSSSPQSGSHVTGTEEVNGRNTQAADHLLALDYQPLTHASEQTSVVLQVQDFVSGGDILFIRKHSQQSTADSRQMMVAIEMKGFSSESPEIEVACCCPVTMKSEVVVPAETVLPTAQIPDYELGDITKLVVMWELRRNVQVQDLTILASTATCHSAELLKMLCVASDKMMEQNVNIVLLEDLENSVGFSGDVISMVYMDKHLTSFVATRWQRAERLVTTRLSCLLKPTQ
ncbi:phenolphthiocerol/phthiocerol polyketide synthase subunit C-like [Babylonia areolata]|uniref:phenolphthiocerol/phthiocerol polyketide synthase subunit C-like n=1 Tax=Babylonia areolata TaxID=304850 RepID=UPI003FD1DACF